MKLNAREKKIVLIVLLLLGAAAANTLAVSPYLEYREQLVLDAQQKSRQLEDAQRLLQRDHRIRNLLNSLEPVIAFEQSAAEGKLLNLIQDWEQKSGLAGTSFRRNRTVEQNGFLRLTFNVSAVGSIGGISTFLYRIETAQIPIAIDDLHISAKQESAEQLQVATTLTILCHPTKLPTTTLAVRQ